MIFFTGCSFTFCEGLYYYKWLEEGTLGYKMEIYDVGNPKHDNERCWSDDQLIMSDDDYSWLDLNGWAGMVSKDLNTPFFKDRRNGGSNPQILENLSTLHPHIPKPKLIVIQWTDWTRGELLEQYVKKSQNVEKDIVNHDWEFFESSIESLDIPFIFVDWRGTYYKYSPSKWKNNFISYKDNYNVIAELMKEGHTLTQDETLGLLKNEHLSMSGCKILSDIVVEKIKGMNIDLDDGFSLYSIDKPCPNWHPLKGYAFDE